MAISEENGGMGTTMLVQPSGGMPYGAYGGNGLFGNGGDIWSIFILFILLGGWNGNGYGAGNNGGGAVQRGFDQASVMGGIGDINTSINALSGQICNSFANAETAANARATANLQQMFGLQQQLSNCCCENRLASADLKYTIATENCADRYASAQNTRDIIENCNRNNQAILDKLCNLELAAKNDRIADLERQLTMANLAASQGAQTSRILADNAAQTSALEQYLAPTPRPAYIVQNPNCCANAVAGCGCGCGM